MKRHGMRYTRFYKIYDHLRARCNNPNDKDYPHYGGRGIKCLWKDFIEFRDDMYESYVKHVNEYGEKQTTIDRINFNGNYCKENCRWATMSEQNLNKGFAHGNIPAPDGTSISITRFCQLHGLSFSRVQYLGKKYNKPLKDIIYDMYINPDIPHPELVMKERPDKKIDLYTYGKNCYKLEDLIVALGIDNKPLFMQRMAFYRNDLNKVLKKWYKDLWEKTLDKPTKPC